MDKEAAPPEFPFAQRRPFEIAPEYGELRGECPVSQVRMPTGELAWLVTRYDDVRTVLTDSRVTADRLHPGYPVPLGFRDRAMLQQMGRGGIMGMDPPEHSTHRRLLVPEFTVQRMRALRPRTKEIVEDCVADVMAATEHPVDLVPALAVPVPSRLFCELLEVPRADHDFVHHRTRVLLSRDVPDDEKRTIAAELPRFYEDLVARKEKEDGDDLLSRIMAAYRAAGMYERGLMARMVGGFLVSADTTANMIPLGVVALMSHPEQLALLKEDPALAANAVDELLRFFSPTAEVTGYRAATADIEIGGAVIKEGDGIIALTSAANRDERTFERPDELDVRRPVGHHLAFGFGVHQCLGQNLARMILEVTFGTLFERIPDLRLAVPVAELPFRDYAVAHGLYELPVTW
ncbi:MAG TPA: cytochrome P450 [Pseudonocardiaceae bacterium]|nr:cytochrome P450 [Pseudonocardiaceae bacterium]